MKILFVILLIISVSFAEDVLSSFDNRFAAMDFEYLEPDTINNTKDTANIMYPAQAMIRSLAVPGWGQIYNKDSWWKPVVFAGVEIAGIVAWWELNQKAEDLRIKYESFADDHWNLSDWYFGTLLFEDLHADTSLQDISLSGGSHDLTLIYQGTYISSDTLATPQGSLLLDQGVMVLRNRDFYENIGKYDRFVAGWDDTWESDSTALWWKEEKEVEDGYKIIIITHNKNDYLNQREDTNTYLNMASYAVSAVLFNHVVSALEAVWTAGRNNEKKKLDTSLGLMYNKSAPYGIGGVSFSMVW